MRSRNKYIKKKSNTHQVNRVKPDDSATPLADTMDFDNDIDEWKTEGKHKVSEIKSHIENTKTSFTIHTPSISHTNQSSGSKVFNFIPVNKPSGDKLEKNNHFKSTNWIKNQSIFHNDEAVEKPDDFSGDDIEYQVEEYDISQDRTFENQGKLPKPNIPNNPRVS